ncbi:hypothetical protein Tsubulata_006862 [Turnera subulata]|uniref:DUF4283 domain-containing protein n=1 Tax=Turnera subulata TaxID=218843 RepID=A0A9Q0GCD3_9ROSI|nr:hypothetical protein Tsubulata_006862 [Turnera subulata]
MKTAPLEGGNQGPIEPDPGVIFIPTTNNMKWLARSAVGVLRNPASMGSVHLLWVLHGMREVEVSDMGGDRVLVSFPNEESMKIFLQQQHDWISLWFSSFKPWQDGGRAVNRRCWIQVRGIPLNIWCEEFFEFIGSLLGRLVRVHPSTEQRKNLGAAWMEILATQGETIAKSLMVKVLNRSYKIEVVEVGCEEVDESSMSSMATRSQQFELQETDEAPAAGEGEEQYPGSREQRPGGGEIDGVIPEIEGDPFNLMPLISERNLRSKKGKNVAAENGINEPIISPSSLVTESQVNHRLLKQQGTGPVFPRSSLGSSFQASPTPTYNPYGPLEGNDDDDDTQGPPGFTKVISTPRNKHVSCASLKTPAQTHSASYNPTDPDYILFLENRLAKAISLARVSTRKKFKKVNPQGHVTSADYSQCHATRECKVESVSTIANFQH